MLYNNGMVIFIFLFVFMHFFYLMNIFKFFKKNTDLEKVHLSVDEFIEILINSGIITVLNEIILKETTLDESFFVCYIFS